MKKKKTVEIERLKYENALLRAGYLLVIGCDEAGRGPLAGPVAAGAVAIIGREPFDASLQTLLAEAKDSKLLTAASRARLHRIITRHPRVAWGSSLVKHTVIDRINIFEASKLAMARAVLDLLRRQKSAGRVFKLSSACLVIDGNKTIGLDCGQRAVVKGDRLVFSCSAASIVAKVVRDRVMDRYAAQYPDYGFEAHRGYPTKKHREALSRLGVLPIHRKTFAPVKSLCDNFKKISFRDHT